MPLIPHRFLIRCSYPCKYVKRIPKQGEELLDLPEVCRIDNFAAVDDLRNFADFRLAWNELGLGVQFQVQGKEQAINCDGSRLKSSDGLTLWIDTRDSRTSHRASRYCHQFHFLPCGGGPDRDEPVFAQTKINRALQDSPFTPSNATPFRCTHLKSGYWMEAFLPASALNGYDADQNPRLGFYYAIRDSELGDQVLTVDPDFPYWEDPSLWSTLELIR